MTQIYNDPAGGAQSSIGDVQFNDFYWQKKALIEAAKETYFGQMADTTSMPKHMGKTIKKYHYLPLLDDANINDQGIDAAGAITNYKATVVLVAPGLVAGANGDPDFVTGVDPLATSGMNSIYITGEGTITTSITNAQTQAKLESAVLSSGNTVVAWSVDWATTIALYIAAGWKVSDSRTTDADFVSSHPTTMVPVFDGGNLYGSSKDVGTIAGKMPTLSENGGRVNRVGFRRVQLEGTLEKFGFFDEYTQESLDFDTDAELASHVNMEMVKGANEITEDQLQIDLLNSAGVIRYAGDATTTAELSGETGSVDAVTYTDLMRLSIDLDDNRTPKSTKLITGSRMVDTKVVNSARYMMIGSELIPSVRKMTDISGAGIGSGFISVEQYGNAGTIARGEIGQVDQFKMIVVPEMMHWASKGAATSANDGYRETNGNYDVFPMLVVGSESFTTVGFQTDGKSAKFSIKHVKPGSATSYSFSDPYGELGFMSIKWYYGFMVLRPERIALIKTIAEW